MNPLRSTLFIRFALAMGLVALLAVLVAAGFLYMRYSATNGMFREGTLRSFAQRLAADLQGAAGSEGGTALASAGQIQAAGGVYAVLTESGVLLGHSEGLTEPLAAVRDVPEDFFTVPRTGSDDTLFGYSVQVTDGLRPLVVQVAFPPGHVLFDSILEEFVEDIAWIWLPFIAGILATALVVGRIALRPLSVAASQAEMIGPGSVSRRLPEGHMPRDVLALVQAVNRSLDRLQQGYESLEEFVGDVAHELRTPLAIMNAQIGTSQEPLAVALKEDVAAMERIVAQLLDRVRLGGLHVERGDVVDLVEVSREAAAMVAIAAVKQGRSLELFADGPVLVEGARDFLVRAVRNLLENAVCVTPKGTSVTITVGKEAVVEVRDCGPGFPERFLDPAARIRLQLRSDRRGGVGLGLSIVDRTMAAHGGRLDLANAGVGRGAIARMVFQTQTRHLEGAPEVTERPQSHHETHDAS